MKSICQKGLGLRACPRHSSTPPFVRRIRDEQLVTDLHAVHRIKLTVFGQKDARSDENAWSGSWVLSRPVG
jgi:hypothetical protein